MSLKAKYNGRHSMLKRAQYDNFLAHSHHIIYTIKTHIYEHKHTHILKKTCLLKLILEFLHYLHVLCLPKLLFFRNVFTQQWYIFHAVTHLFRYTVWDKQ